MQSDEKQVVNNNLLAVMNRSFEYWSGIDEDSPINCLLVWKKILKDNSKILKNKTMLINNSQQDAETMIEQFLESWSDAIQESSFDVAKKSMQNWKDVWETVSKENSQLYSQVLETLEKSWNDIQSKNIE